MSMPGISASAPENQAWLANVAIGPVLASSLMFRRSRAEIPITPRGSAVMLGCLVAESLTGTSPGRSSARTVAASSRVVPG